MFCVCSHDLRTRTRDSKFCTEIVCLAAQHIPEPYVYGARRPQALTHTHTHTHAHIHTDTHTHTHTHTCTHAHTHARICTHTHNKVSQQTSEHQSARLAMYCIAQSNTHLHILLHTLIYIFSSNVAHWRCIPSSLGVWVCHCTS